jgi:hypothetical protein
LATPEHGELLTKGGFSAMRPVRDRKPARRAPTMATSRSNMAGMIAGFGLAVIGESPHEMR